jgi:hypothetical protein
VSPSGKRLILVVNGSFFEGVGDDFLEEHIPVEAIVAVEECPDNIIPTVTMGWNPNERNQ